MLVESFPSLKAISKPPMLIEDLIPKGSITFLVGPTFCGKTFLALEIGLSVAFGKPFLGKWTTHIGNVLLIEQDAPRYDTGRAIWSMGKRLYHDTLLLDPEGMEIFNNFRVAWHPGLDLFTDKDNYVLAQEANRPAEGTSLIILDTLNQLQSGDENSNTEMGTFMQRIKWLRKTTNAAIIILHHGAKNPTDYMGVRGAGALESAAENIFRVTHLKKDDIRKVRAMKAKAIQPPDFTYLINTIQDPELGLTKTVTLKEEPKKPPTTQQDTSKIAFKNWHLARTKTLGHPPTRSDCLLWGETSNISRATVDRYRKDLVKS